MYKNENLRHQQNLYNLFQLFVQQNNVSLKRSKRYLIANSTGMKYSGCIYLMPVITNIKSLSLDVINTILLLSVLCSYIL